MVKWQLQFGRNVLANPIHQTRPAASVILNHFKLRERKTKSIIKQPRRKPSSVLIPQFLYLAIPGRKEANVLFNDELNTFYLRLYGVRHMAKDHSDREKGNPLPPHRLLFPINSKGSFYASSHRQDSTYHGLCYTSREALAGTRNSSMGLPHEG